MLQSGLAARLRSSNFVARQVSEPVSDAAAAIAETAVDALQAQGARLYVESADDGMTQLAATDGMDDAALPPGASFLIADNRAQVPLWRHAQDGVWLLFRLPIGDDGAMLVLAARFGLVSTDLVEERLTLLAPGLKALAAALFVQRAGKERLASYQSALDRSELAILLIGCDSKLLFANTQADRLLEAGEYLRRKGDGISARDLADAIKLQVAIEHVCAGDGQAREDPVVALKRRHPLRPLLVCVSPVSLERDDRCDAGAILRVIDPDRELQVLLEPICGHYRLSPVETRLACQLAKGATMEAAAASLRIKPQTARSYLKQIFLKTDTNRQSELIRLLLTSTVRALPSGRFRIV